MNLNLWHLYLRKKTVYVPTVAQTEAGYFMDIDPVEVIPVTESEVIQRAIMAVINKGNPIVATPTRANFPTPVVLKYANVKTWSAFEKGTLSWTIERKSGNYQIRPKPDRGNQGSGEDATQIDLLPPGTGPDGLARRIIASIQGQLT
jgi:hypothetical protein